MTETNVRIGQWIAWGGEGFDGFYIEDKGLKGVIGGVGVRSNSTPRPQAHGDFDVPVFRSSRFVTIGGECHADSAERLDWYSNVLTGLLADGDSGRVVFDVPGGARWGIAKLDGIPEFEPKVWGEVADWQLSLKFDNPRLYRDSRTFTAGAQVFHYGNFKATPVITVTGSAPSGYTINGPAGKRYTVIAPLVAGIPHVIDMADGYLRINGFVVSRAVTRADLFAIPGGAPVSITVTPVSGSASLSVLVLDTFL